MTEKEKNQLSTFEARLRQLMFLHDELRKQNSDLRQTLAEKEQRLQALQQDYTALESNYLSLKQARTICVNDGDVDVTKQKLSRLVREIDKCLALLNG